MDNSIPISAEELDKKVLRITKEFIKSHQMYIQSLNTAATQANAGGVPWHIINAVLENAAQLLRDEEI